MQNAIRTNNPIFLEFRCPKCKALLAYFNDDEKNVEYLYCAFCNDASYDVKTGKFIGILE